MPDDALDLEHGDPEKADAAEKKATTRTRSTTAKKSTPRPAEESGLVGRCSEVFDRIGEALLSRGDEELGTAFKEEKQNMSKGLVSLTRNVKPLRNPLLIGLALVEPVLAFGRVGGIIVARAVARRQARIAEWEAQNATPEPEPDSAVIGGRM